MKLTLNSPLTFLSAGLIAVVGMFSISANAQATQNIVEVAVDTPSLSTLVTAVTEAELAGTLSGTGPFTVLAPDNDAFAALPAGVLDALLLPENQAELQTVLQYHVISGDLDSTDVTAAVGTSVTTLEGSGVAVSESGGNLFVNTAQVTTPDVDATNGIVHVIDEVLIPSSLDVDALLASNMDSNLVRTGGYSSNVSTSTIMLGLFGAVAATGFVYSFQKD